MAWLEWPELGGSTGLSTVMVCIPTQQVHGINAGWEQKAESSEWSRTRELGDIWVDARQRVELPLEDGGIGRRKLSQERRGLHRARPCRSSSHACQSDVGATACSEAEPLVVAMRLMARPARRRALQTGEG